MRLDFAVNGSDDNEYKQVHLSNKKERTVRLISF